MIIFQYCSKLLIETFFGTPMAYVAIRCIEGRIGRKTKHG